jgi:O-acetyl-ADP-ribose deacetylase (regulator of RNase III)
MSWGDEVIMKFDLVKSNIINVPADAIVLPANSMLKEGSGTSAAILKQQEEKILQKQVRRSYSARLEMLYRLWPTI